MSTLDFKHSAPEEMNISESFIVNFLNRLEMQDLPIHSMILLKHDHIVAETYYAPYKKETLHRMFSITKSFVSIAIGLLEDEKKLSLDDKIISYFPEKLPKKEDRAATFPYLEELTIRMMLKMQTCHAATTYKFVGCTDWVGSFFTTPPNHAPGTTFSYDTSSTHVLCALVEKLTGKKMLDYLRDKFLNEIGFSKEAYVLETPAGESLGGSGLMATPMDILRFMYTVVKKGNINGKQLLPASYVEEALKKQSDTYSKHATYEEMQGYGYQFWMTTHNGIACYGMGGQYALYYPQQDIMLITTADTQGRQGGTQLIYDAFYQEILDKLIANTPDTGINQAYIKKNSAPYKDLKQYLATRTLFHVEGNITSPIKEKINGIRYHMDTTKSAFRWICLNFDQHDKYEGSFDFETEKGVFSIPFGLGYNQVAQFPIYNCTSAISGAFRDENTFLIKAHLTDESVGNVFIQLVYRDNKVTVMMRKVEETMFKEFDGIFSGTS